jgi:hypothetical protein
MTSALDSAERGEGCAIIIFPPCQAGRRFSLRRRLLQSEGRAGARHRAVDFQQSGGALGKTRACFWLQWPIG